VVVVAECENGHAAFTGLGERGKPMEKVAEEPSAQFLPWWKTGAAVDEHLADQLVLPLALVPGESRWTTPEVTEHLRTVLWLTEQFLPIRHENVPLESAAEVRLRGVVLKGRG
jgi:RNA 3'-terminal phosphate cyclase (ATP)